MDPEETSQDTESCTTGMTRKQFLALVTKRAAMAGVLLITAAIADRFLVPPAYAAQSSPVGGHETSPGRDTTANNTDRD